MFKYLFIAVLTFSALTALAETCSYSDCHSDIISGKNIHSPAGEGSCLDCHMADDSLIVAHEEDPETHKSFEAPVSDGEVLCFMCHEDNKTVKKYVHGPVAAGDCTACHDPHSSDNKYQLKENTQQLCLGCHTEKNESMTIAHKHQPVIEDCTACHNPHNSDHEMFLEKDISELCFDCHNDIGERVTKMEYVHAPVEADGCPACHNVHGSENPYILYDYFPESFYNDYEQGLYKLCFECHDDSKLSKEGDTGFRNGDQNLHWVHVTMEKKGRSCKACHEVHASSQPLHIRAKVPFGSSGWELPIKFTQSENGGSCVVGCHKMKAYDRETPAENK